MTRYASLLTSVLLTIGLLGCYSSNAPLVSVGENGYGPKPRANAGHIPPGPEHQACRNELGLALDRADKLERDLANCKRDRNEDKDKWEREKKKLERERDAARDERDTYKKQLERLRGH